MLAEIELYRNNKLLQNIAPNEILFFWRTHGGAHARVIVRNEDAEEVIRRYKETYDVVVRKVTPLTKEEILAALKRYIEFDYRDEEDKIKIAVMPQLKGKMIGKGGRIIKTLESELNKRIILVDGIRVSKNYDTDKKWYDSEKREVNINEDALFIKYYDPSRGFAVTAGWVAPWKLS